MCNIFPPDLRRLKECDHVYPLQVSLEQAGHQLPGHGGDGRVRGHHPGHQGPLHTSGQAQQPQGLCQR